MPIHNWTKVRANRFHDFHQGWLYDIRTALNQGLLPDGYFALAEQRTGRPEPDVVTLSLPTRPRAGDNGGVSVVDAPVKVSYEMKADTIRYAEKADRSVIYHPDGSIVAVIEIVSPGNKASRHEMKSFVRKAINYLRLGIHLLIIDLFPPTRRDPQGIHGVIWERVNDDDFELPAAKPLTLTSYVSGQIVRAYVEPVAVGEALPDMPIFLSDDRYVSVPLEATYMRTWGVFPDNLKGPLVAAS